MFSRTRFSELIRQPVIVRAGGVEYRGTLVEVTMEDVKLRGATGWIVLPLDRVHKIIRQGEETRGSFDPLRESSAELFMDDETLQALQDQEAAEALQAAATAAEARSQELPAVQPEADIFDPSELTSDVDFNPVPMAPYDEETPTEWRDLPGIPVEDLEPMPAGPAQAPPVAAPGRVDDATAEPNPTFRPPAPPPSNRDDENK